MARTVFTFYTHCRDPEREQELSDWYDQIHIPDVEAIEGFASCRRYRLTDRRLADVAIPAPAGATYLSIVEAELGVDTAMERLQAAIVDWHERGRMSDLFEVVAADIVDEANPSHRFS